MCTCSLCRSGRGWCRSSPCSACTCSCGRDVGPSCSRPSRRGATRPSARAGPVVVVVILSLALAVGFLVGRAAWLLLRPTFALPVFACENHRGRLLATGAGVVLAVSALVVEGGRALAGAAG